MLIAGSVLSTVSLGPGWQVRSNCGTSTVWPSYSRIAASSPVEAGLPVWAIWCHDGSGTAGLSGALMLSITSGTPPPDSQSTQPTLPGPFLHSGTL